MAGLYVVCVLGVTQPKSLVLQAQRALVPFNTTWRGALPGGEIRTYNIVGLEPAEGPARPLYIFAGGYGDGAGTAGDPTYRFVREMAARGFAAAIVEIPGAGYLHNYPNRSDLDAREEVPCRCNGDRGIIAASEITFTYRGPKDTSGSALATLCDRARVNCDAGIALHGSSLGALLIGSASRFARGVTAELIWAAGGLSPGSGTCCGVHSGLTTCCEQMAGGVVGGTPLECMRSTADSPRRRYVIAAQDYFYGDCNDEWRGNNFPNDCSADRRGRSPGAVEQCRMISGRDCGASARSCIDPADGTGYYVPTNGEIGTDDSDSSHEFHMNVSVLNAVFVESTEPWGLTPSMDWLEEQVLSHSDDAT